jgi:aspartyl-tRNA(Asn)/glutamyl-tRNA(Gln) amidotransferase subunit A
MRGFVGQGALVTAADYAQAQKVRRIGRDLLADLYETVDLVVTPTATTGAPALEGLGYEFIAHIHTPYWNAVGNPVLALPIGLTGGGLPLSMQLCGRPYEDALVLRAGDAFQRLTDHHLALPPVAATA